MVQTKRRWETLRESGRPSTCAAEQAAGRRTSRLTHHRVWIEVTTREVRARWKLSSLMTRTSFIRWNDFEVTTRIANGDGRGLAWSPPPFLEKCRSHA